MKTTKFKTIELRISTFIFLTALVTAVTPVIEGVIVVIKKIPPNYWRLSTILMFLFLLIVCHLFRKFYRQSRDIINSNEEMFLRRAAMDEVVKSLEKKQE